MVRKAVVGIVMKTHYSRFDNFNSIAFARRDDVVVINATDCYTDDLVSIGSTR